MAEDHRQTLGKWIDERATELDLSWEEVAERAGMTTVNLRRIRKGQQTVPARTSQGLNRALRVPSGFVESILTTGLIPPQPWTGEPREELAIPSRGDWVSKVLDRYEEILEDAGAEAAKAYVAGAVERRRAEERRILPDQQGSREVS